MATDDLFNLEIEISADDATEEELDRLTRNLLAELRESDVESVQLVSDGQSPEGSKGDPVTLGQLALEILPAAIPGVIALVQTWVMRGQGRTVKYKSKGIELEGSPEELKKMIAKLDKEGKKKSR